MVGTHDFSVFYGMDIDGHNFETFTGPLPCSRVFHRTFDDEAGRSTTSIVMLHSSGPKK